MGFFSMCLDLLVSFIGEVECSAKLHFASGVAFVQRLSCGGAKYNFAVRSYLRATARISVGAASCDTFSLGSLLPKNRMKAPVSRMFRMARGNSMVQPRRISWS